MKDFKLSKEREEALFNMANSILLKRKEERLKQSLFNRLNANIIAAKQSFTFNINLSHMLIPAIAAVLILLITTPKIEYYEDFIDLETTVTTPDFEEGN